MTQTLSDRIPAKTTAGIVMFCIFSLLSSIRLIVDAPRPPHVSDDITARSDQRFSALKGDLPAQGVIGYIGESSDFALPDYYLAQYALAPLVVDRSSDHKLVVGNFPSLKAPELPPALRQVRDFGNGVVLFANKDAH